MARPKLPLEERLTRALSLDELDFNDPNCWHGPKLMLANGKNTNLLRTAFALMLQHDGLYELDELHPTWTLRRPDPAPCQTSECRNPRHWTLNLNNWRGIGPMPEPLPIPPKFTASDLDDAVWELTNMETRKGLTPASLAIDPGTHTIATYAAAIEQLTREGYDF